MKNRTLEEGRYWEPCEVCGLPKIISDSWSANGGSISHGCAHCLVQDRNRLLDAAREALEVLGLCDSRTFNAPEDDEVMALGRRIGFGALMSAASKTWAVWAEHEGVPPGGHFMTGPCAVTVERTVAMLRKALEASPAYHPRRAPPTGGGA